MANAMLKHCIRHFPFFLLRGVEDAWIPKFSSPTKTEIRKLQNLSFIMFLFEVKRTFGSKVVVNLSKGFPKSRMHFFIIPIHLYVKTLTLRYLANLLKILFDQIIVIFDNFFSL